MAPSALNLSLSLALGVWGIAGVVGLRHRDRSTTLAGTWFWAIGSVLCVSAAELTAALVPAESRLGLIRLAAGCATFCPVISLLGAKRPQDRGWHFVVGALWLVLMLPTLEAAILRPGQPAEVHGLRAAFMALLITGGFVNALPTRYWFSALLLAAAQVQLLAEHLPAPLGWFRIPHLGLGLYSTSFVVAAYISRHRRHADQPIDQLWLDFRDAYGLLWGLRVAEQVNSASRRYGWNLWLRWNGFRKPDGSQLDEPLPAEADRALRQNLDNLLRRFVSSDWIAQRLAPRVN